MTTTGETRPVAVVTGAASGIGKAIARRLVRDGFDVLIHTRANRAGAEALASELNGGRSHIEMCDFSDEEALAPFGERCIAWRGRIDAWVNNAGADVLTGGAAQISFEAKLRHLLHVDVVATILLSRLAATQMMKQEPLPGILQRATIVNMGWDQADTGMEGDSGQLFAATKGAIMAVTRSLAKSFAPGVRVNAVAPGWIRTKWGIEASEKWQERARSESLLDRWGTPEDVASVVSFLCGPDAGFVTGQIIPVNGGFRGTGDAGFE